MSSHGTGPLIYSLAAKMAQALLTGSTWTFGPTWLRLGDSSLSLAFSVRLFSLHTKTACFGTCLGAW